MALRPRQLADEIEATLEEARFGSLRKIYDDMYEPRARAAHMAESLMAAAEKLPQQWETELADGERALAIERQRELRIREERDARILEYQEEVLRLENMVEPTEERERVETEVLELRGQNSQKALEIIASAKAGGLDATERRQQAALHFAQYLPLDIERARAGCKTPTRAWRSVGLLSSTEPETAFAPLVAKFPAIEQYLATARGPKRESLETEGAGGEAQV